MTDKMEDLGYDFEGFGKRATAKAKEVFGDCPHCGEILNEDGICTKKCEKLQLIKNKPASALAKCGVPKLYRPVSREDWDKGSGRYKLFDYEPRDIYLYGSCGTGKTHFAATLMKEWLSEYVTEDKYEAKWTNAPYILARIRETYSSHATESELDVINTFSRFKMLVIDDLGAEKVTDWSISALYQIISNRINECKVTIVTSNLSLEKLAEWNERISSRMSGFFVGEMKGEDRRLKK
jgi:predicted ATPase